MKKIALMALMCLSSLCFAQKTASLVIEGEGKIHFKKLNLKGSLVYESDLVEFNNTGSKLHSLGLNQELLDEYFPGAYLSMHSLGLFRWGNSQDERDHLIINKDKTLVLKDYRNIIQRINVEEINVKNKFLSKGLARVDSMHLSGVDAAEILRNHLNRLLKINYRKISGVEELKMSTSHHILSPGLNCYALKESKAKDTISCSFNYFSTAHFEISQ